MIESKICGWGTNNDWPIASLPWRDLWERSCSRCINLAGWPESIATQSIITVIVATSEVAEIDVPPIYTNSSAFPDDILTTSQDAIDQRRLGNPCGRSG